MILIAAFLLLLTSCSSTATLPEEGLFSKNSQGCQNIPTITYQPLTTYYVSTSGDDTNDGLSADKPWKNLSYAEKTATEAGSMIALKKGDVFEMNHSLGIHHGGVTNTPIVWDGATWGSGDQAVIKSTSNREAPEKSMVNIIGASHVIFQNITLDGNHTNTFGIVVGGTDSYYSSKGYQSNETNIVVQNNKILNSLTTCCRLFQTSFTKSSTF